MYSVGTVCQLLDKAANYDTRRAHLLEQLYSADSLTYQQRGRLRGQLARTTRNYRAAVDHAITMQESLRDIDGLVAGWAIDEYLKQPRKSFA